MSECIKRTMKRFGAFWVLNIPGTLLDLFLVWLLSTWVFHTYVGRYVASPILAFIMAMLLDFVIFYKGVWGDRIKGGNQPSVIRRLLYFSASAISTFGARILVIQALGLLTSMQPWLCDMTSMVFSGIVNYILNDKWVFRDRRKKKRILHETDPDAHLDDSSPEQTA